MEEILAPGESKREDQSTTEMEIRQDHEDQDHQESDREDVEKEKGLKGKKLSWPKLRRYDSLDIESRSVHGQNAYYGHSSKAPFFFFFFK